MRERERERERETARERERERESKSDRIQKESLYERGKPGRIERNSLTNQSLSKGMDSSEYV